MRQSGGVFTAQGNAIYSTHAQEELTMAVAMIMRWAGVTPEQYEAARSLVNWEGDLPPGAIFHVCAFDEEGLRVTDVWERAEDFQAFVESRLMPGVQQLGIQGQPEVEILPVHRMFTPGFVTA
jgi:hypothetical protein